MLRLRRLQDDLSGSCVLYASRVTLKRQFQTHDCHRSNLATVRKTMQIGTFSRMGCNLHLKLKNPQLVRPVIREGVLSRIKAVNTGLTDAARSFGRGLMRYPTYISFFFCENAEVRVGREAARRRDEMDVKRKYQRSRFLVAHLEGLKRIIRPCFPIGTPQERGSNHGGLMMHHILGNSPDYSLNNIST